MLTLTAPSPKTITLLDGTRAFAPMAVALFIGLNNAAVGYGAGSTGVPANANTTGSSNTFIGYNAGPGTSSEFSVGVQRVHPPWRCRRRKALLPTAVL